MFSNFIDNTPKEIEEMQNKMVEDNSIITTVHLEEADINESGRERGKIANIIAEVINHCNALRTLDLGKITVSI